MSEDRIKHCESHWAKQDPLLTEADLDRRAFLRSIGRLALVGGVTVPAAFLIGCDSKTSPLGLAANSPRRFSSGGTFYPENYNWHGFGNDNTASIRAAIDAAHASGGGTVELQSYNGSNAYRYSGRIEVKAGVILSGAWSTGRARMQMTGSQRTLDQLSDALILHDYAGLQFINFYGPGKFASAFNPCVDSGNATGWVVDNCDILDFSGQGILTGDYCADLRISNNGIYNNGDAGIQIGKGSHHIRVLWNSVKYNGYNGVDNNGDDVEIANNLFEGNGTAGNPSDGNGILLAAAPGFTCDRNRVYSNRCLSNNRCGIFAGPMEINNPDLIGVTHSGTMADNVIESNTVENNGRHGILVENIGTATQQSRVTVRSNIVHGHTNTSETAHGFLQNGDMTSGPNYLESNDFTNNLNPYWYHHLQWTASGNTP